MIVDFDVVLEERVGEAHQTRCYTVTGSVEVLERLEAQLYAAGREPGQEASILMVASWCEEEAGTCRMVL